MEANAMVVDAAHDEVLANSVLHNPIGLIVAVNILAIIHRPLDLGD
jgi:hypothetical protein